MKKYLLGGASQNAAQWDGSRYIINHGELITLVKRRWLRDSLFRVESDGRIVQIGSDIIDRYFRIWRLYERAVHKKAIRGVVSLYDF